MKNEESNLVWRLSRYLESNGESLAIANTAEGKALTDALRAWVVAGMPRQKHGLSATLADRAPQMADNAGYVSYIARDAGCLPCNDGWGAVVSACSVLSTIFNSEDRLHELVTCYTLTRASDPTGVSGTGDVAYVTLLTTPDGSVTGCLVDWLGETPTHTWHRSMESVERVHCHGGASVLVPREVDEAGRQELAIRGMLASTVRTGQWGVFGHMT